MTTTPTCPHRCFFVHVHQHCATKSALRLMGLAVGYTATNSESEFTDITLDDGTALIVVQVPQYMMRSCQASPHGTFLGKLLDCIVRVVPNNQQYTFRAEQISIHEDDPHAELVRWFELSWQPQPHISREMGYPVPELTPDDFLEVIQLDCSTTTDTTKGNNINSGVSLEDLAIFFQLDQGTVEEFLTELQMTGQIYRNQQGNYLPL